MKVVAATFFLLSILSTVSCSLTERETWHKRIADAYRLKAEDKQDIFLRLLERQMNWLREQNQTSPPSLDLEERSTPSCFVVNALRPGDIKVVAALGDSITAAFGAKAEYIWCRSRGISWSIGGDETLSTVMTLPNILKQYNPNITGYSIGISDEDSPESNLNRATSGAESKDLPEQMRDLINKMLSREDIDVTHDWKIVTIWIGSNDLCNYCDDREMYSADNYENHIRQALLMLKSGIPRVFVNLVQGIDVTELREVSRGFCSWLHRYECSCATTDDENVVHEVQQMVQEYNNRLIKLSTSPEFNDAVDFAVVVQPFLSQTKIPRTADGEPDMEYFAPDCFHFSEVSHRAAALALWNNMFEPVGNKTTFWEPHEPLTCPPDGSVLYTNSNSNS